MPPLLRPSSRSNPPPQGLQEELPSHLENQKYKVAPVLTAMSQ